MFSKKVLFVVSFGLNMNNINPLIFISALMFKYTRKQSKLISDTYSNIKHIKINQIKLYDKSRTVVSI